MLQGMEFLVMQDSYILIYWFLFQISKNAEWNRKMSAKSLRSAIERDEKVSFERRIYVKFPDTGEHSYHPTGIVSQINHLVIASYWFL